ncbi:hypothetical protein PAPYR_8778 [Paratrimastix pyriformis]|uniref:Uncharacterized protein n=1 Tax=Paratrimastix pyriformis TaxID=342808 RepID=A0ABQ8UEI7_9EUKA|nr:hypothetical protein PAPYR_8778 [Paratrimastix pyriformis]
MEKVFEEIKKRRKPNFSSCEKIVSFGREFSICSDNSGGVAGSIWNSAFEIISYLEERGFDPNVPILDLGSGTGVMLSLSAQARLCVLSDLPEAEPLIQHNIILNHVEARCCFAPLRWGWAGASACPITSYGPAGPCDLHELLPFALVIVSDCLYKSAAYSDLACTLAAVTRPGSEVIFAYSVRIQREHEFLDSLTREGSLPRFEVRLRRVHKDRFLVVLRRMS